MCHKTFGNMIHPTIHRIDIRLSYCYVRKHTFLVGKDLCCNVICVEIIFYLSNLYTIQDKSQLSLVPDHVK